MPSLDRGDPAGTLQTLFQDTRLPASSDRSATSISVQPAPTTQISQYMSSGSTTADAAVQDQSYMLSGSLSQLQKQLQLTASILGVKTSAHRCPSQKLHTPIDQVHLCSAPSNSTAGTLTLDIVASTQDVPQVSNQHAPMASPGRG